MLFQGAGTGCCGSDGERNEIRGRRRVHQAVSRILDAADLFSMFRCRPPVAAQSRLRATSESSQRFDNMFDVFFFSVLLCVTDNVLDLRLFFALACDMARGNCQI